MSHEPSATASSARMSSSDTFGLPARVVRAEGAQVADVADVVAAARLVDVLQSQALAGERPRSARSPRASRRCWPVRRRGCRRAALRGRSSNARTARADVVRVDVVAHLLALVARRRGTARRRGRAARGRRGSRAARRRRGSAPVRQPPRKQTVGMSEVAAVLLHEQVGGGLGRAEEAVQRAVDAASSRRSRRGAAGSA